MSITTKTVTITPKEATKWLEGNTHNRTIREGRVKQYAQDMAEGRWMLSHQGIAFDEEGTLVDGQHRLWAIIESDTSTVMMVSRGVPMSAQMIIDDHLQRTAVDALRLSMDKNITHSAAALVGLLVHGFIGGRPSHVQVAQGLERFRPAVEFCDKAFRPRMRVLTQSAVQAVVARAYYSANTDQLSQFVQCLMTGLKSSQVTEAQYNAAMLLRNHLLFRVESSRKRSRREDVYARTERSLYAFLNEEPIKKLYPAKRELFPLDDIEEDAIAIEQARVKTRKRRPKSPTYPARHRG